VSHQHQAANSILKIPNTKKKKKGKYPTQNRVGRVVQVVECLPSNCEVLSSNLSTAKKKKKGRKEGRTGRPRIRQNKGVAVK
jgi:hypothetical protein